MPVQFACRIHEYESSLLFQYHTLLTLEETGLSNQEVITADKFVEKVTQAVVEDLDPALAKERRGITVYDSFHF